AEASMELAYSRGKLIEQDALLAAKSELSLQSIQELAGASKLAGQESGFFLDALTSLEKHLDTLGGRRALATLGIPPELRDSATPELLERIGTAFDGIVDPTERADLAFKLFGDDAKKYLPEMNHALSENVARMNEWGGVIGDARATEINMFKRNVDSIRQDLQSLTADIKAAWEGFKNFFGYVGAWLGNRGLVGARMAGRVVTGGMPNPFGVPDYFRMWANTPSDEQFQKMLIEDQARFEGARRDISDRQELGEIFGKIGQGVISRYRQSREGVQAALSAAQARRAEAISMFERAGRGKISLSSTQQFLYGQQLTSSSQQVADLEKQIKVFNDADEAARKAADGVKQFHDAVARLNDAQLSDTLDMFRAAGFWAPDKNKSRAEGVQTSAAQSTIDWGMQQLALGRLPGDFEREDIQGRGTLSLGGLQQFMGMVNDQRSRADSLAVASLERERRMTEQLIQIRTGPGGEAKAIEDTYKLRLDYAQREYDINRRSIGDTLAGEKQAEQIDEARIDRITEMAQLERKRFDEMKQSAEGLIDAVFTRSRSVLDALKGLVMATFLTPIKEAAASWIAAMMMPLRYGGGGAMPSYSGGGAGLLGGLLGFGTSAFGQVSNAVGGPGETSGFAGPINARDPFSLLATPGAMSLADYISPSGATSTAAKSGLGAYWAGLLPYIWNAGSIAMGAGTATTAAGIGGAGGYAAGFASSPAGIMMGGLLAYYGARRGGVLGTALAVGGGALAGFGIGAKIGSIGGPLGMAIGAGAGLIAGLIGSFRESPEEKTRKKIKAIYGIDVRDKGVLGQIYQMAQQFGGNLEMAIRSPQIRDLIELYAQTTGQKMPLNPNVPRPVSLAGSGGALYQMPTYYNGTPYSSPSSLPTLGARSLDNIPLGAPTASGAQSYTIKLDGPATTALLRGEAVTVINDNPRAVQRSVTMAQRSSYDRRSSAALTLVPGQITG
ncbi:MAG: hypothetical protein M1541_00700, partial [Acidobacteria bacterium]|nr:hypothetical protein [Acidobacteriota bacterium]